MLGVNHTSSQDESSLGLNLMSPFPTNSITSAHVVNPEQHDVIPSSMPPYPTNYVYKSTHWQPCVPGAKWRHYQPPPRSGDHVAHCAAHRGILMLHVAIFDD